MTGRGLATAALALLPWQGHADDPRTPAGLKPGSTVLAQAGGVPTGVSPAGWQFTVTASLWTPRTEIELGLGDFSRSATLDFSEIVEDARFGVTTHVEATRGAWTLLLDVLYFKLEKEGPTETGVPTEVDFEQVFLELGGTYRLAALPVGRAGRVTVETLAGGRLMYVDAELTIGASRRLRTATFIDPMVGGRIAYHVTNTVVLWLRGDVAGFGLSDSQSQLAYRLVAGLDWRFARVASVFTGWRYMHLDIDKGSGARTLAVDLSMNGPFLGLSVHF